MPLDNGTSNNDNGTKIPRYVFLYYTEARENDGEDMTQGKQPLGNAVYRYELINNKLVNPKLLLNLPASPGAIGNGGSFLSIHMIIVCTLPLVMLVLMVIRLKHRILRMEGIQTEQEAYLSLLKVVKKYRRMVYDIH
jgi:hypothetical protein